MDIPFDHAILLLEIFSMTIPIPIYKNVYIMMLNAAIVCACVCVQKRTRNNLNNHIRDPLPSKPIIVYYTKNILLK